MAEVKVKITGTIRYNNTKVKSRPSDYAATLKTVNSGALVNASKMSNGYYYIDLLSGWVKTTALKITSNNTGVSSPTNSNTSSNSKNEISVDIEGTIVDDQTVVRKAPSAAGTIVTKLDRGTSVTVTKENNGYFYITSPTSGWIRTSSMKAGSIDTDTKLEDKVTTIPKDENTTQSSNTEQAVIDEEAIKKQQEEDKKMLERQLDVVDTYLNQTPITNEKIKDSLLRPNLNGIYGIPYQFMESVDPRIPGTGRGRKYSDKIIAKMPLLCITPGKVKFMSNFSKSEKIASISALLEKATTGNVETVLDSVIKNNGRYFTFAFDYDEYFNYVNGLCRAGARFLDIQDQQLDIGGTKAVASKFDWKKALNSELKATFTSQEFIGFYMDSTDSVSESFSNETTQSQLSSTLDGVSDLGREIGFLLGAGAGKTVQVLDQDMLSKTMTDIDSFTNQYLNGNQLIKNIANGFAVVASGGRLLFPEIWADSSFSRNFDITIKLRTPDADVLSWYLNIYVPLCHLVALVAGHQTDSVNGYYSPFLVRAFYKGLFNIDMGIVTDMSITKGKEAAWNIDGLPTEIDVNMTIKDLYNMLSITPGDEPKNFVTNNIMMDYIANTCGVNINQMDIARSLEIYYILTRNRVTDLPNRVTRKFQDAIDTYAMELYNSFMNKFLL